MRALSTFRRIQPFLLAIICFFFLVDGALAKDSLHELSAVLGEKNVEVGLNVLSKGDGVNEPVIVGGASARRIAYPQSKYMYVVINQAPSPNPVNLYVTVLANQNAKELVIEYDKGGSVSTLASRYTTADLPTPLGGGNWYKVSFYLPEIRLAHGQNFGADFRLVMQPELTGSAVAIRSIEVSTSPPNEATVQPVSVRGFGGSPLVANASAALAQIPGHPDLFVGRSFGIRPYDFIHDPKRLEKPYLALYRMDWRRHLLVMQNFLLKPEQNKPVNAPNGFRINACYDPHVVMWQNEFWVACECSISSATATGAVSAGIAPLTHDFKSIDVSRFTPVVLGHEGPHGPTRQIVTLVGGSAPTLLVFNGRLFLYWQLDPFDNNVPQNLATTRGIELYKDAHGRLWGVGSGGKPVLADDDQLTQLVYIPNARDETKNHVAVTSDLKVFGGTILELGSIGGTAGKEICRSTHDTSPGCWRMNLSTTTRPLGANVFGEHELNPVGLPSNTIEYPRIITGPDGRTYLMGFFITPKCPLINDEGRILYGGTVLGYIPFDVRQYVR